MAEAAGPQAGVKVLNLLHHYYYFTTKQETGGQVALENTYIWD